MWRRRFYCRIGLLLSLTTFVLPLSGGENEWTESYLQRDKESLKLADIIFRAHSQGRQVINLNGVWHAKERNTKDWSAVTVPGVFDFEGEVVFKRSFLVDSSFAGRTLKLAALGINNRCTVFVNDHFIGGHEGGYTSFNLNVENEAVNIGGENEIRIIVDNKRFPRTGLPLKHNPKIVYNYGGIFRDIYIVGVDSLSIRYVQLSRYFTDDYARCRIALRTFLETSASFSEIDTASIAVLVELRDPVKSTRIAYSQSGRFRVDRDKLYMETDLEAAHFKLWEPDVPKLYELTVTLKTQKGLQDGVVLRTGFQEFAISDSGFVLNGKPFTIKGLDWYEDFPHFGPTAGWETVREEVLRIKELGANAIRVVGTPPHPYFLDLCDELGLVVFEEMPLSVVPDIRFLDDNFAAFLEDYFLEMIARDTHHVSLVGWGLGNDLEVDKPGTNRFIRKSGALVRELSHQLVYLVGRDNSVLTAPVDFCVLERYPGDLVAGQEDVVLTTQSSKPYLLSLGSPFAATPEETAKENSDRPGEENFSHKANVIAGQEAHAFYLQEMLRQFQALGQSSGYFIHTFADWTEASPNLAFGRQQNPLRNHSGLLNFERKKRLAAQVLRSAFLRTQPQVFQGKTAKSENPVIYPVIGIVLILIFLYGYNRSARLRGHLRRIFKYPHGFYTELKDNRKIPLGNTLFIGFITCLICGLIISSIFFRLRNHLVLNEFFNLMIDSNLFKIYLFQWIWQPSVFILFATLWMVVMMIFLTVILRIISFILGQNLRFRQFFTLICWASANLIWMLPIVPIYYRVLNKPEWVLPAGLLPLFFILWCAIRLLRGIKVVYRLDIVKTFFLAAVVSVIVLGGIGLYFNNENALFDYLPVYWRLAMGG
ncbi:MAG: glycoside hydrolase family 2 TIM barrel-domain containing protein [bacterium]